jgi:hypothetical protein
MKRNCILRRGEILINFAFEPGEFPLFLGMAAQKLTIWLGLT